MAKLPDEVECPKCGNPIELEWGRIIKTDDGLEVPMKITNADEHRRCKDDNQ